MSVANKKRLSRIKGINWKKVILWTFNIVCYIITFIFTISLIIGSVKDSKTSNQQSTNSAIDINAKQQYGLVVDSNNDITINDNEINVRYYVDSVYDLTAFFDIELFINDEITFTYSSHLISDNSVYSVTYLSSSDDEFYISYYFDSIDLGDDSAVGGYFIFSNYYVEGDIGDDLVVSSITISSVISSYTTIYSSIYGYYYGNPNEDIFDTIGDTIPSFVSTLNIGLTEAVTIFYDDGLTTIGYLSAIVVAVVLGYFSLRAVMGLVRLRG